MSTLIWIDDHIAGVTLRKPLLESCGYSVLTARTGREGLDLISTKPVQGIIVDGQLPDMPGEVLVQKIRAINAQVPVVVLTRGSANVPAELANGADAVFTKAQDPFASVLVKLSELIAERPQQA